MYPHYQQKLLYLIRKQQRDVLAIFSIVADQNERKHRDMKSELYESFFFKLFFVINVVCVFNFATLYSRSSCVDSLIRMRWT